MGRQRWGSTAGCALAIVLAIGGVARAEERRIASLTTSRTATSARSSDAGQASLGFAQAGQTEGRLDVLDSVADQPAQGVKSDRKRAAAKGAKHTACVHGEWVTPEDYNPWTLSCNTVGF